MIRNTLRKWLGITHIENNEHYTRLAALEKKLGIYYAHGKHNKPHYRKVRIKNSANVTN